jgi:nucleoside-diphosphate-sugar epimerase
MNREKSMKVALLGGSGTVGRFLIQRVSEAGYEMRVLARNPDKIKPTNMCMEIVQGDARDFESIRSLLQGCDTVLNALGQRQEKSEAPIFSTATGHVLTVMKELGVRRYILVRGFSIDAPGDHKDLRSKLLSRLVRWVIPEMWADWQKELETLLSSNVEWTLVRLPIVVDEPSRGQVRVDLASPPGKKISGYDLANFVVDQITEPTFVRKAPFIGN